MCEYCGCQQIPAIAELTREHDAVRSLLRALREAAAAGDVEVARRAVREVEAILGPHTAVEERALFPAMAREYPDHVGRLVAEHRTLTEEFDALLQEPPPTGWRDQIVSACRLLIEHILREQDGLFPAALSTLDPEDWLAVDAVRSSVVS